MARLRSRPRDPMRPVAKAEVLPARPCCCASLAHAEGIGEDDIPAARVHHSHLRPARSESCSAVQAQQRSHDCLGCVDLRSRHQSTALVGRFMVGLVVGDEARAGGDAPRRQAVAGQRRQKHRGENGDDGDYHKQLNQGKSRPRLTPKRRRDFQFGHIIVTTLPRPMRGKAKNFKQFCIFIPRKVRTRKRFS